MGWAEDLLVNQTEKEFKWKVNEAEYVFKYIKPGWLTIKNIKSEYTIYTPQGQSIIDEASFYEKVLKSQVTVWPFPKERLKEVLTKAKPLWVEALILEILGGTELEESLKKNLVKQPNH